MNTDLRKMGVSRKGWDFFENTCAVAILVLAAVTVGLMVAAAIRLPLVIDGALKMVGGAA